MFIYPLAVNCRVDTHIPTVDSEKSGVVTSLIVGGVVGSWLHRGESKILGIILYPH